MDTYTEADIIEIYREKVAEHYYGTVTLHFQAGRVGIIDYHKTEKKEDALRDNRKASSNGYLTQ